MSQGMSFFMSDTTFREPTPVVEAQPTVPVPDREPNNRGATPDMSDAPLEGIKVDQTVLNSIGLTDSIKDLPVEIQDKVSEVTVYVTDILKAKGVSPNPATIERTISSIKEGMGIDPDTDPVIALDRISGVVKSYKGLAFISDPKEKRSLFMKMARLPDSQSMDRLLFDEMEKRKIWRQ